MKNLTLWRVLLCALAVWILATAAGHVVAQDDDDEAPQPTSQYCLLCHADTDRVWTLPSGEELSLEVDLETLQGSVHGDADIQCSDCHIEQHFPHDPVGVQNIREFKLQRYASCRTCHEDQYLHAQDSVHGDAIREGEIQAAVCVDCHGAHDIQPPDEPREKISQTCGQCHGVILNTYQESVHGTALFEEGNPDVPTCIDCHGVHDIESPTTTAFRVRSPDLCENCHADAELMEQYGISTNVVESYVTDFHGTTVALFEQQAPDVKTNKAVCYDCHGVHNIAAIEDGTHIRETLVATCQQCHPNADADFSDAWVGHYPTTLEENPVLTVANSLYSVLIPGVGLFLLAFVTSDIFRRIRRG